MPNYMLADAEKLDADLTKVADSIRAKGGTTEPLAFPDGFVSAVDAIVVKTATEIKRATGTFRTSKGSASVNCGFQPDAVIIPINVVDREDSEISVIYSETSRAKYVAIYNEDAEYCNGYCTIKRTTTGFSISNFDWYTDDWEKWTDTGTTYNYTAIKYTE